MIRNRASTYGLIVVMTLLILAAGCGGDDGDGPVNPDNGTSKNPVAAGFAAVAAATGQVLTQNADVLQSLDYFGPKIIESLGAKSIDASGSAESSALQSCLPLSLQGQLFAYDMGQGVYVSTQDPAVPPENVRYVLYEINASGVPSEPITEIGYLEAECRGQLPKDTLGVTVSTNGVNVVEIELRGISINPPSFIFGASPIILRDSGGAQILELLAVAEGTVGQYLDETVELSGGLEAINPNLAGVRASIGREFNPGLSGLTDPPFNFLAAGINQTIIQTNDWWRASVGMIVDADGSISNIIQASRSPLEFESQMGNTNANGIYACFSGQYDGPLVERAASDGGCATGVIDTPLPLTAEELAAVRQGYLGLLALLDTVSPMWTVAMGILTP